MDPNPQKPYATRGVDLSQLTRAAVVKRAVFDALGLPALVLLASMAGFGSLARESGLGLGTGLLATAGVWGLPGQLALAELYAAGAGSVAVVLAVSLANARFLPMAVSLLPLMSGGVKRKRWLFLVVQLLSINSWAASLRSFPQLPVSLRVHYFVAFALVCMVAGLIGTAIGYLALGILPRPVSLGLIFLNPVFFAMVFANTTDHMWINALIIGAVAGPLLHLVSPDWGLLATGLVAGTPAFWLSRARERARRARP